MATSLCRCGQEEHLHPCLTGNGFSVSCLAYDPMDFGRFEGELTGDGDPDCCCCDLCNAVAHAVSLPLGDRATPAVALWDALVAGTHTFLGWDEWVAKLRANRPSGPKYQSSGSLMGGLGVGVTPGGVTGGEYRRRRELGDEQPLDAASRVTPAKVLGALQDAQARQADAVSTEDDALLRAMGDKERAATAGAIYLLEHPECCSTAADYPDWTCGGAS